MKIQLLKKLGIGVLMYIFTLLFLFVVNFLFGFGYNFHSLRLFNLGLLTNILILAFVFPYLKINSKSLIKRGLFFGLVIWMINLPQVLREVAQAWYSSNIFSLLFKINGPVYFILFGLLGAFLYKTFLPSEYRISVQKLDLKLIKTIKALVLVALISSSLMIASQFLTLKTSGRFAGLSFFNYLSSFGGIGVVLNYLIFGTVLSLFHGGAICRLKLNKFKKWLLFVVITFVFVEPLIISAPSTKFYQYWQSFSGTPPLVLIGHLLCVAISGWVLTHLLNENSSQIKHN